MTKVSSSGVVVPQPLTLKNRLAASAAYVSLNLVMRTWRCSYEDNSGILKGGSEPVIYCLWHNRLALAMRIYEDFVLPNRRSAGLAAMISASKDGGVLAAVVSRFGLQPIRGSTSRRGRQALLESVSWLDRGYDIAITPDGPRGPCYRIHEGIVALAQLTGRPIVPLSSSVSKKIQLKSWDRFQIPLPLSRCEVRFGKPLFVPRDADEGARENLRLELAATMMSLTVD